MAITVDPATLVITVPQADCTFVSGTFYRLPTETVFRAAINDFMDSEAGMPLPNPITHNTEVTVAGVTYARFIEVINGYSVEFSPNSQWTVELTESNNNLFDVGNGVLVQNQVQVITTNAAGLIVNAQQSLGQGDLDNISDAVWNMALVTWKASIIGGWITKKLLTVSKFLSLK